MAGKLMPVNCLVSGQRAKDISRDDGGAEGGRSYDSGDWLRCLGLEKSSFWATQEEARGGAGACASWSGSAGLSKAAWGVKADPGWGGNKKIVRTTFALCALAELPLLELRPCSPRRRGLKVRSPGTVLPGSGTFTGAYHCPSTSDPLAYHRIQGKRQSRRAPWAGDAVSILQGHPYYQAILCNIHMRGEWKNSLND